MGGVASEVAGIAGFCRLPSIVFGVSANATRKIFLALFNDHDCCVEGKMMNKKCLWVLNYIGSLLCK